jgi:hypothetical protein
MNQIRDLITLIFDVIQTQHFHQRSWSDYGEVITQQSMIFLRVIGAFAHSDGPAHIEG